MPGKRKGLGKKVRFDVFRRDLFACQYCGGKPPAVILEVDHVLAVANGGGDDPDNLITSCRDCNRGKGATDLKEVPQPLASRMAERREQAEQLEAYNAFLLDLRQREDAAVEQLGLYWYNLHQPPAQKDLYVFGPELAASARRFVRLLPLAEIMNAMEIAQGKHPLYGDDGHRAVDRTWRYFCGVCWRKIKGEGGLGPNP